MLTAFSIETQHVEVSFFIPAIFSKNLKGFNLFRLNTEKNS